MAAFFIGIKEAQRLKVEKLWVECDSASVVSAILSSKIPWSFLQVWWSATSYFHSSQWRITHCYREGNTLADALAKRAATSKVSCIWDTMPSFILHSVVWEALGRPLYRFE
ncbi:uncharacterized protein LOC122638981 [Telopea speciosissima]|uniref:uncharacterized protein LOC122638981 n=1 Tax=Telopea speciosissima TaxID=54955 RepID=UPI001CC51349|nr:uncharacterized protein LOC122638981 [Telopea speciosissima]